MNIEALNCRCCGGVLNVKSSLCVCDYCGTTNFISDVASKYINQLNRANKLRQEREFDNAARIYDVILEENAPTADILWLRTLCEYGIEYVPDPVSDKYFPTLHRINDESILTYQSYIDALSLADKEQKKMLQKEAEYINTIQNEYLHIAEHEAPYDVFICYKETDEATGEKTEDVELAQSLYEDLTGRGFKVFFAKETLKTKLSIDYEPYIFAALKSSKAMVVLGTKAEYFMSVWVKNEWGRFLKLMQNDENKQMFFACDDPEELPRAFANKQAQLLGSDNALKNLADNVERFLKDKNPLIPKSERDILYNRALSYIRSRNDFAAKPFIERLIDAYPDYAPGYWLRVLNKNKANSSVILRMPLDIYSDPDYIKAVSLADRDLKEEYTDIAAICKKNLTEQEEFDKILEAKSIEYVKDFRNTELGRKKSEIMEKIIRNSITVDIYNNRIRRTLAIGLFLFVVGSLFFLSLWILPERVFGARSGFDDYLTIVTILSMPMILAGTAIMLSYNLVIDILTSFFVFLLLINSTFLLDFHVLMRFLAVILPVVVFFTTGQSDYFNKYKYRRQKASLGIEKDLEELRKVTENAGNEMNIFATKLLKQYKDDNKITSLIEIKDDDYFKGLKNINNMYESARDKYIKYVGVSNYIVRASYQKDESDLGMTAFILSLIPFLHVISCVMAIIDLLRDKYKEHKHFMSVLALIVNGGISFLAIMLFLYVFYII